IPGTAQTEPVLSGMRVEFQRRSDGHTMIYDIVSRTSIDATKAYGVGAGFQSYVALWGNYLAFMKPNGAVYRKDLSSKAAPVRLAAAKRGATPQSIAAYGDWVAWTRAGTGGSGYRNAQTKGAVHSLPSTFSVQSADVAGVVGLTASGANQLHPWSGGAVL